MCMEATGIILPDLSTLDIFRQGLAQGLRLAGQVDLLGSAPSVPVLQVHAYTTSFQSGCWSSKLKSSSLLPKYVTEPLPQPTSLCLVTFSLNKGLFL